MEIIAIGLLIIGGLLLVVGNIWFLVVAFQESALWGIGCLVVPFVALIFLVMHFGEAKKPFFVGLIGAVIMFAGALLGGDMQNA